VVRGLGVTGILLSDFLSTAFFSLALLPILLTHAAWSFSGRLLRATLSFGLPKVPHGVMLQIQNLADRKILDLFVTRAQVGIYQMGYTFGLGVKFALSAVEPAWQPFVYSQLKEKGASTTLARVVSYAFAGFAAGGLATAVLGREMLVVMTPRNPSFWAAAPVIPVVALAYVLQGVFLLTSIGIGIEKKARYYPLITTAAAVVNVGGNFALIPRYGVLGAAWATVLSYGLTAGLGLWISQRLHPLPFEWGRLLKVTLGAAAVFAVSTLAPRALVPALAMKGALLLLAFPGLLLVLGFWGPAELKRLWRLLFPRSPR